MPFFRAANGVWTTANQNAAVALGMQPLAVVNTIADWETQDEATLTTRLRTAMKSGEVVLMHDGGGSRAGTVAAAKTVIQERLDEGWTFTLPAVTLAPSQPPGTAVISADFEDGLQGWVPRATDTGQGVLAVTDTEAHGGAQSALLTERTSQGHGIGFDATGVLIPGTSYEYSAWVRFAPGQTVDDLWLSLARTVGDSTSYDTLKQFTGMSNSEWVQVTGTFQMAAADSALLYFETPWENGDPGNISDFLVDDVVVTVQDPLQVQDLAPIKDTVDFPVGVGDRQPRADRGAVGAPAPALRPGHLRELHEAGGLVRRRGQLHAAPRGRRDHAVRAGQRDRRVRAHAGVAQPDAGLVLPGRRGPAAHRRARPTSRSSRTGCGRTSTPSPST